MSTQDLISVKKRTSCGTGAARACRSAGMIPGIIYGGQKDPETIMIDPADITRELHKPTFFTHVYSLDVEGKKEQVLAKEVQYHPVTDLPVHIDFMRVAKGTKLNVHIPIHFINEDKAPGIKKGGVLNVVRHTLEVVVPADRIPDAFTVDLTGCDAGKAFHIEDLKLPSGVVAAHPDRDNTIATIAAPAGGNKDAAKEESAA